MHNIASRDAGLKKLREFTPRMGQQYTARRNYDRGPGQHNDVSCLSPYIRRRIVTEVEVIQAALEAHGADKADKFIQEVLWRGYFKGWLEQRPSVWSSYVAGREDDLARLQADHTLAQQIAKAEAGATGLACFDAWARELVDTGYLHNHARMWFASIWIFTFGLPWRLGADFFYRHLLDGDPASNTCSWRWVAGLHTRGKVYEAQAWNISKFTEHRFAPREADLVQGVQGLEIEEPDGLPDLTPLRRFEPPRPDVPTLVLMTEEDCGLDAFDLAQLDVRGMEFLCSSHLRSSRTVSERVAAFEEAALSDVAVRAGWQPVLRRAGAPRDLVRWAQESGAAQIAMPYVTIGPLRDWIEAALPHLSDAGISLAEWRRDWDGLVWPFATAGFFKVKKKLPRILEAAGLL